MQPGSGAQTAGSRRTRPSALARWAALVPRRSLRCWLLCAAASVLVTLSLLPGWQLHLQRRSDRLRSGGAGYAERRAALSPGEERAAGGVSAAGVAGRLRGGGLRALPLRRRPHQRQQRQRPPLSEFPPTHPLSPPQLGGEESRHPYAPGSANVAAGAAAPQGFAADAVGEVVSDLASAETIRCCSRLSKPAAYREGGGRTEDETVYRKAHSNLVNNEYLILAVASNGNFDFTLNWIASLRRTGHTRYLVMCLDEVICSRLDPTHAALVPRHWLQREINAAPAVYGTSEYINLVQSKTLVVIPFLMEGFTILFTDVDVVWLSPQITPHLLSVLKDNPSCEAVFSVDEVKRVERNGGSRLRLIWHGHALNDSRTSDPVPSVNTGFWIAKPTSTIIGVFNKTVEIQVTQQSAFNTALKAAKLKSSPKIAYLDRSLFPNGRVYFKHRLAQKTGITPFIVHANYIRGSAAKRSALKEAGLWLLDDDDDEPAAAASVAPRPSTGGSGGGLDGNRTDGDARTGRAS
ncbi:MAG: nucleotide-diphospho-sugar transferase-domain-containing protein [Olpidium bornovanus]|uniref:Nucleotide-diphospho-sugar transferase-domain-containing protein n=1 Tax=Olpidium bornovanus TaxID=278681 RepID=A0A8H8DM43_9FUNG|nr:MAG: nucleotide-diphospho-sugar transferase-domain-containing protein [Olpidium bornovanus]